MTTVAALTDEVLLRVAQQAVAVVMELAVDDVTPGTGLGDDLGADSLALIEIVEVAEEQLRARQQFVRVDDDVLARLVTVADLIAALRRGTQS